MFNKEKQRETKLFVVFQGFPFVSVSYFNFFYALKFGLHSSGPQGAKPKAEVVADILASIKERRA